MLLAPPAVAFIGGGKGGMEKLEPGRGGAVARRAWVLVSFRPLVCVVLAEVEGPGKDIEYLRGIDMPCGKPPGAPGTAAAPGAPPPGAPGIAGKPGGGMPPGNGNGGGIPPGPPRPGKPPGPMPIPPPPG